MENLELNLKSKLCRLVHLVRIMAIIYALFSYPIISAKGILKGKYWFDDDINNISEFTVDNSSKTFMNVDCSYLNDIGIHRLNIQLFDEDGVCSPPFSRFFVSLPNKLYFTCCFDNQDAKYTVNDIKNSLEVGDLKDGLHRITLQDHQNKIYGASSLFYKIPISDKDLKLVVSSDSKELKKSIEVEPSQKYVDVDLHELPVGYHLINTLLVNAKSQSVVRTNSSIIERQAVGNRGISDLYYWFDNNSKTMKNISISDGKLPYRFDSEVSIPELDIPVSDYELYIDDGCPYVAPRYILNFAVRDKSFFMSDTSAVFSNYAVNSALIAPQLENGTQVDFDSVNSCQAYWGQFFGQEGDEIKFEVRRECLAKIYSPDGDLLLEKEFSTQENVYDATLHIPYTGMHYVQISKIQSSKQNYSVRIKYLSGPSVDSGSIVPSVPEYNGIPIEWNSVADWKISEDSISLSKFGIDMIACSDNSIIVPNISEINNYCNIPAGASLLFKSQNYIEKITICLSDLNILDPKDVQVSEGVLAFDMIQNNIVWTGLSKRVKFSRNPSVNIDDLTAFRFDKAYVEYSDYEKDEFEFINDVEQTKLDYTGYSRMVIYDSSGESVVYKLSDNPIISVNNVSILVKIGDQVATHQIGDRIVISFDNQTGDVSDASFLRSENQTIKINGGKIIIDGLPGRVSIYSLSGIAILSEYVDNGIFTYPLNALKTGVYIVSTDNSTAKIYIK